MMTAGEGTRSPTKPAALVPPGLQRDDLFRRLAFTYGPERAVDIIAGRDPATLLDIARWRNLGRRRS